MEEHKIFMMKKKEYTQNALSTSPLIITSNGMMSSAVSGKTGS